MSQLETYKQQILTAALPHIPFDGWTQPVLERACDEANIETGYIRLCFPHGPIDAVAYHSEQADRLMTEHLAQISQTLPVPVKVKQAILWRLKQNQPHREAIRKGYALLSFPLHSATGLKLLYQTVDAIWYGVGDSATDYNFYTKRLTLAAVYSATLTFWLDDDSENQQETEAFLDRRLNDVRNFGKAKQQCQSWFSGMTKKKA